jgi:hypothetical protein
VASPFVQFHKPIDVLRKTAGAYVDGVWVEGEAQIVGIMGSLQPLRPTDLQLVPEGRRDSAKFRLYTDQKLVTTKEGSQNPDIVSIDDSDFEIIGEAIWQNGVIPHNIYILGRMQE